jgi:hypothetical protein
MKKNLKFLSVFAGVGHCLCFVGESEDFSHLKMKIKALKPLQTSNFRAVNRKTTIKKTSQFIRVYFNCNNSSFSFRFFINIFFLCIFQDAHTQSSGNKNSTNVHDKRRRVSERERELFQCHF